MPLRRLAFLAAIPLLAACAPEFETTVALSDLAALAQGEVVSIPTLVRLPHGSLDTCRNDLPRLSEVFAALMPVEGPGTCIERGGDVFAELNTAVTLSTLDDPEATEGLVSLVAAPAEADSTRLSVRLLRPIQEVTDAITLATGNFAVSTEFDDHPRFIIHLENDLETAANFNGHNVFVDNVPAFPDGEELVLEPEARRTIILSDVASVWLADAEFYTFATITASPQ